MEQLAITVTGICKQILLIALMVIVIRDITHIMGGGLSGSNKVEKLSTMLARDRGTIIFAGVIDILFPIVVALSINENSMISTLEILDLLSLIAKLTNTLLQVGFIIAILMLAASTLGLAISKLKSTV